MLADELGHLEHIDDLLACKHGREGFIRVDVPLILRVLELVLLDVGPELLGAFASFRSATRPYKHDIRHA